MGCWLDADRYEPFSHLTSPSVTDSANAGVLTVTTSSPTQTQVHHFNTEQHPQPSCRRTAAIRTANSGRPEASDGEDAG